MKYTQYFEYTRLRPDRAEIKEEWIAKAFFNPVFEVIQNDGRTGDGREFLKPTISI